MQNIGILGSTNLKPKWSINLKKPGGTTIQSNIKANTIVTFKVVTGKNSGQYLRVMPWQSSADYDKDKTKELNYWKENVSKFVDPIGGAQRWTRMKWGDMNIVEGQSPSKYLIQTDYIVKPSKWDDFRRWLERIGEIYGERIPEHKRIIVSLVSGGNWNQTTSFIGFDKYSRTPQKFDNTWEKDYNKKFGANSFDNFRRAYNESHGITLTITLIIFYDYFAEIKELLK